LVKPYLGLQLCWNIRCKNLLRHWRIGIEEAGIKYLYLAIGFLE